MELKPDEAVIWSNKGSVLHELGKLDEALKAYEKAIELEPDCVLAWFNRACAYSVKGDKEKALSYLEKAIELDTSNKERAKEDEAFKILWCDEDFKKLVA
ncbi:MAG: tetratricopeptide repeat protein [Candidatus Methanoperedens sp.]|nr:tetratricopeptide repeat protein [Candidatus Methanoperedens sp.]